MEGHAAQEPDLTQESILPSQQMVFLAEVAGAGGGAVAFFGAALGSAAAPAGSGLPAWARAFCSSTTASSGGFCAAHAEHFSTSKRL